MHELLLERQDALSVQDLKRYAAELGLDTERFIADLHNQSGTQHIAEDVESADVSSVSGAPTFFINGIRHHGAYDIETLAAAVKLAEARSTINRYPGWQDRTLDAGLLQSAVCVRSL